MTTDRKSFKQLLDQAPIAAETVSLVGTLSRSAQPDKFVITLGNGRSLTLDVDAVKDHTVMGGAIGQPVVKVELDAGRVPSDLHATATEPTRSEATVFWHDVAKSPVVDGHTAFYLDVKAPYFDVAGPVPVPPGGDPWGGFGAGQMLAPFALATPHQAAPGHIAAIQAAYRRGNTLPWPIGWGGNDPILHKVMVDPIT